MMRSKGTDLLTRIAVPCMPHRKKIHMAVSKRLRYEILRRDNHTCRYCGASAPDVPLRVDHVTPVALGGGDKPENLVTSCEPCNSGKSSATVDSAVVADVSNDALRWADAMKQAAEELRSQAAPKRAYRDAFQQAWNEWTWERNGTRITHSLPDGWKSSLDNFREAGLPTEVWPDIIEKAMTSKTVNAENLFRYSCGIGWRMVRELQDRAKAITGENPAEADPVDSVVQAALDVWAAELIREDVADEARQQIQATAQSAREQGVDAHRIVEAAQWAAWSGLSSVGDALHRLDLEMTVEEWNFAWHARTGDFPDIDRYNHVQAQVEELLSAGVSVSRVERAAAYAGAHRSARLYFGLSDSDLVDTKGTAYVAKAAEIWATAYEGVADRWPSQEETAAFFASFRSIGDDGEFCVADVYAAAAAAGSYEDPDMRTCIPRHRSALKAAESPLQPASA